MRCLKYKFPITGCSRLMGEAPEKVCPECVAKTNKQVVSAKPANEPVDTRKGAEKNISKHPHQRAARRESAGKRRSERLVSGPNLHGMLIRPHDPEELTLDPGPLTEDDDSNPRKPGI